MGQGPATVISPSTQASTSEAFHYLKSLIKQLMKTPKKKHRITLNTALFTSNRLKFPKKPSFSVVLLPLAPKGNRASSQLKLSIHGTPVLILSQSCHFNEAGLSPRSSPMGQSLDEACFLACSFLLPFLGYHSSVSTPKRRNLVICCSNLHMHRKM